VSTLGVLGSRFFNSPADHARQRPIGDDLPGVYCQSLAEIVENCAGTFWLFEFEHRLRVTMKAVIPVAYFDDWPSSDSSAGDSLRDCGLSEAEYGHERVIDRPQLVRREIPRSIA